jgi:hypothetical protein
MVVSEPPAFLLISLVVLAGVGSRAQIPYDRGQNVVPVYEGWQRAADGSRELWFGYFNRNYQEEVDVPIGDANGFDRAPLDSGQPTHFYPRRHFYVFAVHAAAGSDTPEIVWTLTSRGRVERAFGSMAPQWEIDAELIAKNKGGATLRLDLVKNDRPPAVTIAAPAPVAFPAPITLTATVTDDGLPPPPRGTPQQVTRDVFIEDSRPTLPPGLTVRWSQYRGPGRLTFDQPGPTRIGNGTTSVVGRASAPGTYVVRVTAGDGLMETHQNVTVNILPSP